jgi:hypothetical protein
MASMIWPFWDLLESCDGTQMPSSLEFLFYAKISNFSKSRIKKGYRIGYKSFKSLKLGNYLSFKVLKTLKILNLNLNTFLLTTKIFLFFLKIKKQLFYIKIICSGWVIGRPVHFGGMTARGQAVILKCNFSKSCDHNFFFLGQNIRNSYVHPVYPSGVW